MEEILLRSLAQLAERRAINVRKEALMWEILSRDLKNEAKRREELASKAEALKIPALVKTPLSENRLYIGIKEACKIMGIGPTTLYNEIKEGRLPIKKAGRKTMISMSDVHAWFAALPAG